MSMFLDSTAILSRWTIYLFIMDMQKKTVHIMDPLPDDVCYKG